MLFNKAAESILGTGQTDADPETWPDSYGVYLPDGKTLCPAIELPLVRAIQGERVDHAELIIRNACLPEPVWVACRATPVIDTSGALRGGVIVFHDVTARKRAEEEFRLSEQRLQNLLDCLPQAAHALASEPGRQSPSSSVVVPEYPEQFAGMI